MAKIISFFNHKGGVGKTTTVHNLACALKNANQKVLVIDADPQMNLTAKVYGFSTDMEYSDEIGSKWREYETKHTSLDKLIINILTNKTEETRIFKQENTSNKACLHLIPSSFNVSALEMEIVDIVKRNNILDKGKFYTIENYFRTNLGKEYDFILIDFSPSASSLLNGLFMMMSDYFIVPSTPTLFCLQAIENLEKVFRHWYEALAGQKQTSTENGLSFSPKFLGIIISMSKRRTTKGVTHPTTGTKKWMQLVNERIQNFYEFAYSTNKCIPEKEFKKTFPKHEPFIIDISYDFGLELRSCAEKLGKSEYDLDRGELPNTPKSKRKNEHGEEILVHQYTESLILHKESCDYIAKSLISL